VTSNVSLYGRQLEKEFFLWGAGKVQGFSEDERPEGRERIREGTNPEKKESFQGDEGLTGGKFVGMQGVTWQRKES